MAFANELPIRGASNDDDVAHADVPPPLRRHKSSLRLLTELTRERISMRYLHAWKELYRPQFIDRNAFPSNNLPMPAPAACHDTGLAAFAQLAALRLNVRRAFVTIMTRDTEHVLVESTRSMSLQSDFTADEKDKSWLGTSCFARADGINDKALDGWRRARTYREMPKDTEHYYTEGMSQHWCIASDVVNNLEHFQRPFVVRAQSPRFFFSIPLRDSDGAVIGSLSMLDDKPRFGVSSNDMLFCEDLGDTIAQHLYHSIVSAQRQRSERLIKALGTFNDGGRSLKEWWINKNNTSMDRGGRRKEHVATDESKSISFDEEFGVEDEHSSLSRAASPALLSDAQRLSRHPGSASDGNVQASEDRTANHISGMDFQQRFAQPPEGSKGLVPKSRQIPDVRVASQTRTGTRSRSSHDPFDAAAEIRNAYGRASNLLREATGASGVVFLDASAASAAHHVDALSTLQANTRFRPDGSESQGRISGSLSASSDDSSKVPTSSDTDLSDNQRRSKPCQVIARSIHAASAEDTTGISPTLKLNRREIARLIKSYPLGKVFNYTTSGTPYSDSGTSTGSGGTFSESTGDTNTKPVRASTKHARHARLLGKIVGEARSIAFFPVWDATNDRYRSCLFAWTLHSNRCFDGNEDVTYLSAFSHSLIAEISRIETIASDVAKGKFIGSMSHEMRSPLHGILAGVELLLGTNLTSFQEEMALSVALAGRTLLDTVEHILDFSKISNMTRDQKRSRARASASRHDSAEVEGDKNHLTVVDLARMTEEVLESIVSAHRFSRSLEGDPKVKEQVHVSVVLDIDKRDSWATTMDPGSWTRVLTNIVGNALKYTPSGMVKVKLFTDERDNASNHISSMTNVTLQVEDTGIGMTQDFIKNDVFIPFRQADHHSAGTGLGLSIVKEVVKDFRGSIDVASELGKGSCVSVRFVAEFTERPDATNDDLDHVSTFKGKHLHMIYLADFLDSSPSLSTKSVAENLLRTASKWLGCDISSSRNLNPGPRASICVVSEAELAMLNTKRNGSLRALVENLANSDSRLLIFGRSVASCSPEFDFTGFKLKPLYIHQPIAPQKLSRVIRYAKDSTIIRRDSDFASLNHTAQRQLPTVIRGDMSRQTPLGQDRRSYFDMPLHPRKASSPNSLVTPESLMQATTAKSLHSVPSVVDRQVDDSKEQLTTNADRPLGGTILLVEDNPINMRLLAALMKKQSLPYESAANGLEAFKKYKEAPTKWRLILSDLNMPVMDGFESTAKIREYERKHSLKAINICALTGVTDGEARSKAFNAGVNSYLTKPIKMRDITKLMDDTDRMD